MLVNHIAYVTLTHFISQLWLISSQEGMTTMSMATSCGSLKGPLD